MKGCSHFQSFPSPPLSHHHFFLWIVRQIQPGDVTCQENYAYNSTYNIVFKKDTIRWWGFNCQIPNVDCLYMTGLCSATKTYSLDSTHNLHSYPTDLFVSSGTEPLRSTHTHHIIFISRKWWHIQGLLLLLWHLSLLRMVLVWFQWQRTKESCDMLGHIKFMSRSHIVFKAPNMNSEMIHS